MKKTIAILLSAIMVLGTFAACAGEEASSPKPQTNTSRPPASSKPESAPLPESGPIKVFLPIEETVLAEILLQVGEQQNIKLEFATAPKGILYGEKLAEALNSESPPAIYWLEGERDAAILQENGISFTNLEKGEFSASIKALASMVPQVLRLQGEEETLIGLPVGVYATGYIVNLRLLGSLLNAKNLQTLQQDLVECSWEQWSILLQTVNSFLQKPIQATIKLGENSYTMLRFRSEEAQSVRGMFAFPTAEGGLMMDSEWEALFASSFVNRQEWDDKTPEEKAQTLEKPLQELFQGLGTQTGYMTGEDGSLARGESFVAASPITNNYAKDLFLEGKALFIKGDTRLALGIEKEIPSLKGNLGFIPVKLPWEAPASGVNTNAMVGINTPGYICIGAASQGTAEVENLLLALYTTEGGQELLEQELNVFPLSGLLSAGFLANQIESYIAKDRIYKVIPNSATLHGLNETMSEQVRATLLERNKWEKEQELEFVNTALEYLLLPQIIEETEKEE